MNFDHQAIRAGGDTGFGGRGNQVPFAGGVTGIADHRQMAQLLEHGDGVDIQCVARVAFKGADAALAQHHLVVAVAQHILGRHQPLLDRGHHAALEKDRAIAAPHRVQQGIVLHVAGPDLQNVAILSHQGHLLRRHDFGDDGQPGLFTRLGQDFQPFFAHALETVGRAARLERAAAQNRCAGFFDRPGRFQQLLAAFDGARPGHQDDLIAADLDAIDINHGVGGMELAAGQLERLQDAHRFLHPFHHVELFALYDRLFTHHADHRARFALTQVHFIAHALHARDHSSNLGL